MARKQRLHEPGGYYHVMLRGNGGAAIFFTPQDRLFFYALLKEATSRFGCRFHAFCLMDNHVHLAVQVGEIALSKIVQNIAFRYTRKINSQQKRVGHLFQGRYKAILVDAQSYLLELVRYIHLNPVRAGLAGKPTEWRWSGHNAYLGTVRHEWLTSDVVLAQFGRGIVSARENYAIFLAEGTSEDAASVLRKGKEGGRILGDDRFVEETFKKSTKEEGRKSVRFEAVVNAVAKMLKVSEKSIFSTSRERSLARARFIVCLLASDICPITFAEMGRKFGRDGAGLNRATRNYKKSILEDDKELQLLDRIAKSIARHPRGMPKG
jgi:REP element-mobilizing transposase RayT